MGRKYELHPETIRTWIREYRDQVEEAGFQDLDKQNRELKRLQEVEEKYQTAVKILGEKELELEILRDLVKKRPPLIGEIRNSRPVYNAGGCSSTGTAI